MRSNPLVRACGTAVMVCAAVAAAQPARAPAGDPDASGYKLAPGPVRHRRVEITLDDAARRKGLDLAVYAPSLDADAPPAPAVVFSHGAGGSKEAFADLSEHLASHGYVVIHPTHSDSVALRRAQKDLAELRDATRDQIARDVVQKVDVPDRLKDVKFIVDALGEVERSVDGLRIDRDRLAVAGHSAGALTAQLAIGVKVRGPRYGVPILDGVKNIGDERFKAAVIISGQGLTHRLFTEDSWNEVAKPMLVITGSKDDSPVSRETPVSRRHPFEYARPGDKYLIYIEGATHSSYQGKNRVLFLDDEQPGDAEFVQRVTHAGVLAFLDRYLRGDEAAGEYLRSESLPAFGRGKVEFKRK